MNSTKEDDHLRKVVNNIMTTKEDTPAERLLSVAITTLQTSRNKFERELIKGIMLKAGITSVSNKTNREYFIKK